MLMGGIPFKFDVYAEFVRAKAIAERLNEVNPKLPIEVVMTSWEVDDEGGISQTKPVYADVVGSASRLQHFLDVLKQQEQVRQLLEKTLKKKIADEAKALAKAEAAKTQDPLVEHMFKGWF